jgi:hypothetical protein
VACGGGTRRVVLAPVAPQGLRRALDDLDVLSRLEPPVRLLLWLDRVDTFASGGITAEMLRRCRQRSPRLWVVATISTTRYKTWVTEEAAVAAEFGEPLTLERLSLGMRSAGWTVLSDRLPGTEHRLAHVLAGAGGVVLVCVLRAHGLVSFAAASCVPAASRWPTGSRPGAGRPTSCTAPWSTGWRTGRGSDR